MAVELGQDSRYSFPMRPEEIRELITARPFAPFRICLSDGSSHDITNHDRAMVGRTSVEIGVHPDPRGIMERFVRCALLHIVKIEDLQPA